MAFRPLRPNPDNLEEYSRRSLQVRLRAATLLLDKLLPYLLDLELQDDPDAAHYASAHTRCHTWFGDKYSQR